MEPRFAAWSFLRPLLLAVAAAAAWIALSAAGASADSATHNDPLLAAAPPAMGAVTTTVTQQAREALPAGTVSNPAPAPTAVPSIQAAAKEATALADHVAETVPVVTTVVPEGTVAATVDPALGTVDHVVGGTVRTITPVAGAVLEPVLDPVLNAVPLTAPVASGEPKAPALPPVADVPQAGDGPRAGAAAPVVAPTSIAPGSALPGPGPLHLHDRLSCNGLPHHQQTMHATGTLQLPGTDPHNTPFQGPFDALPGTAAGGSGSSSGNGSGMPAWLASHNLRIPGDCQSSIEGSLPEATPPVSFDPGSSPD